MTERPTGSETLPTGVPNLDAVLGGGLRRGALAILMGPPGSGKTILAGQMSFAAARRGQRVLVLTALSEPTTKLLEHWRTFRFFEPALVGDTVQVMSARQFLDGGLDAAAEAVIGNAQELRARFVVLDGFSGLRWAGRNEHEARGFLYEIGTTLGLQGATVVMTTVGDARDAAYFADLTIPDVIVSLHHNLMGTVARRRLEVVKVRAAEPWPGLHALALSDAGAAVYPRLEARVGEAVRRSVANVRGGVLSAERQGAAANPADMAAAPAGRASFGLPELDALLDGGLVRETSTLLAGSVGVGKTAMALHFALAGARAGEPTIYLSFRETIDQLLLRADAFALGPELRRAAADGGTLTFLRFAPIELDPDMMADQLLAVLDRTAARRLVIDSILELERAVVEADGPGRLANYTAALLEALWQRRVTALALRETHSLVANELLLPADPFSMLSENVVLLQQVRLESALHRVLSVVKTRFSAHDPTLREFTIQPSAGIRVLSREDSGVEELVGLAEQRGGLAARTGREARRNNTSRRRQGQPRAVRAGRGQESP